MLAVVEVAVAAVEVVEGLVGATLDDPSLLDDEDLVGAADGGEAVGDDEGGAALHEVAEAMLDEGFGLGPTRRVRTSPISTGVLSFSVQGTTRG